MAETSAIHATFGGLAWRSSDVENAEAGVGPDLRRDDVLNDGYGSHSVMPAKAGTHASRRVVLSFLPGDIGWTG